MYLYVYFNVNNISIYILYHDLLEHPPKTATVGCEFQTISDQRFLITAILVVNQNRKLHKFAITNRNFLKIHFFRPILKSIGLLDIKLSR